MMVQKGLFDVKAEGKLVPYNMFSIVGIVILLSNIIISNLWPFKDPLTIQIFSLAIILLLIGMIIFRYYSTFIALLLIVVVVNGVIFWVCFHLGRASGASLYYFPFMVGFLYLFFYNSNLARSIAQLLITIIFFVYTIFFTNFKSKNFFLPDPFLEKVFIMNLIFSMSATIIILFSIYRQFVRLHQSVLNDKDLEHRKMLRDLDLEREKEGYALLLSLRDNISQTLATSRMYLQMYPEQQEFTRKADEQVKAALSGLNDISVELSPSMLIDLGFKDGLVTYSELLTDKYGIPVDIQVDNGSGEIPEIERLSLYRILQQCISIIASHKSTRFLNVRIHKNSKLCLSFYHDSPIADFSTRFMENGNRDLTTRLDYYSAVIREDKGKVEVDLELSA